MKHKLVKHIKDILFISLLCSSSLANPEKTVYIANFYDGNNVIFRIKNNSEDIVNKLHIFIFYKNDKGQIVEAGKNYNCSLPYFFEYAAEDSDIRSIDVLIMYGPVLPPDCEISEINPLDKTSKETVALLKGKYRDVKYIFTENIKVEPSEKKTGKEANNSK